MSAPEAIEARLDRRRMVQWLGAVMAAAGLSPTVSAWARGTVAAAKGYGKDPVLIEPQPSAWPLILSASERAVAAQLLDIVLPAHANGPAASQVGLVDFLDEWVSAPYEVQVSDRALLLPLIRALAHDPAFQSTAESVRERRIAEIAADPNLPGKAFRKLCVMAAAAYYTSPAGIEAIGFVGNVPRDGFAGPPAQVLEQFSSVLGALPAATDLTNVTADNG
jgi:hypothetical protein